MTARLAATIAAYRAWQAGVAGPQLAAMARGDAAAARVLQADTTRTSPCVLAVRRRRWALAGPDHRRAAAGHRRA